MSTKVIRFRQRFNQYNSNMHLYFQGVCRLIQEKVISHFLILHVQIIDHCDPNDKKRRESSWIVTLQTMYLYGLIFI